VYQVGFFFTRLYQDARSKKTYKKKDHYVTYEVQFSETFNHMITQQIGQCTYNITLRHVYVTIIAVKKQEILHNLSDYL
jgi:hypothetical protein